MKNTWKKLGQLYNPNTENRHPKLLTHAANPLPILLDGDIYRVFYSGRDENNRSSVGAVDVDIVKAQVVKHYEDPFFEHGPKDSFYADGVSIGCWYSVGDVRYILFMGWQSPEDNHWRGDIGRLILKPDMTLELDKTNPVMTTSDNVIDNLSLSYPWVLKTESGYKMWYGSTLTWDAGNGEMLHVINSASSKDGNNWNLEGLSVPYFIGVAQAFSRPTVLENSNGSLEMWFSYRSGSGEKYRIGYAVYKEGKWQLELENVGIYVSASDKNFEIWDSEMIEYPYVLEHKGKTYMFYNGNGYGKTGFGLAVR